MYERIYKGENEMQAEFRKIPVNGKRTSVADQKRIRKVISDNVYRIAKECKVLVSYPRMRIEGTKVNLGAASIMLPDCRLIDIEELKKIELGGGEMNAEAQRNGAGSHREAKANVWMQWEVLRQSDGPRNG